MNGGQGNHRPDRGWIWNWSATRDNGKLGRDVVEVFPAAKAKAEVWEVEVRDPFPQTDLAYCEILVWSSVSTLSFGQTPTGIHSRSSRGGIPRQDFSPHLQFQLSGASISLNSTQAHRYSKLTDIGPIGTEP
jgi:hypothetical protein